MICCQAYGGSGNMSMLLVVLKIVILLETFSGLSLQQFSDEYPAYPIQANNVCECIFGTDNIFPFFSHLPLS